MSNLRNAYLEGLDDGAVDAGDHNGRRSGENLSDFFDCLVGAGVFKPHQKQQYLVGYARGARGEKD